MFEFTGPGRVWTQSRNPESLVAWLTAELPAAREGANNDQMTEAQQPAGGGRR